jgi:hypothetical protein
MRYVLAISLVLFGCAEPVGTEELNGFVLDAPLIPVAAIEHGGPPRDGIPSIDSPRFVNAEDAGFLDAEDRVLGIELGGHSKAYPVRILNRHEIVNDRLNDQPVVVTFCPLCGSGVAFLAEIDDQSLTFGVSGLLYNSDVLLYDRETESLWSQISRQAVNGPLKGRKLAQLPLEHTTWEDWLERYPDTRVLSEKTGFLFMDYDHDPYAEYKQSNQIWFSVANQDCRLPRKAWVLGVTAGDAARAYPFDTLAKAELPLRDTVGETSVTIEFDAEHRTARALDVDGKALDSIQLYWFAWAAFHPDTTIWE